MIEELPKAWVSAPIGDLVGQGGVFVDGDWVESKDQDPEGDVRLIQLADVGDGEFRDRSARFLTTERAHELGCTFLEKGDLLIARMPDPLGRCCIFPLDDKAANVTVVDVCIVRMSTSPIDSKYLMYAINSVGTRNKIAALQSGSTRKRISRGNLATIKLPIAPSNEQRRIVAKIEELFSELDKSIESLTSARLRLKAYRQSVLKAAFTGRLTENWRKSNADKLGKPEAFLANVKLEQEGHYQSQIRDWQEALRAAVATGLSRPRKPNRPTAPDKPSPQQASLMVDLPRSWTWLQLGNFAFVTKLAGFEYTKFVKYDAQGDLEVIKAENAGPKGFRETHYSRVKSDTVKELNRSRLFGGELLMVFVGTVGNVAMVPVGREFFLGPNIAMMRITSKYVIPAYVEHFLRSPQGRELALSSVKAVAQPSLSMGTIRQIPVALPPLDEQAEIVRVLERKFEAADVMEAEIETGLARSNALRQSILKRAFSGQLVAQDPSDEPAAALLERIRAERDAAAPTRRRRVAA